MEFKLNNWFRFRENISHLIFPESCISCGDELTADQHSICHFCYQELEFTHFEKFTEPSPLDKLFWGRVDLNATFALLHFQKGKASQKILHSLKYQNNPSIGVSFGELIAKKLKKIEAFRDVDLLVPVPIHPKKRFVRGYNQSEQLAEGITNILSIPMSKDFIHKRIHTESQTKNNRFIRWDNVVNNFAVKKVNFLPKHIALVDDVITTGSTLEALIQSIHEIYPDIRISIISLALTK